MASAIQPGQLLFVGFPGLEPPPELFDLIRQGRIGGVVLFARNVEGPSQLRALLGRLHGAAPAGVPLMVSVDQEGGRVQRMREPWTRWPPMRSLGERGDLDLTRKVHQAIGLELNDLGIELNFSPVADVATRPDNPVIGDRAFAAEPDQVSAQLRAAIEGLHASGVASCAKHFPGHGDTDLDSHFALPSLAHDLDRLRRVEWPPFRAAVQAGVASLMTAHVLFPALDPKRPATLSPEVLGHLREEIGFDGLVFTDDLEMKAVASHFSVRDRCLGALEAGADALLICSEPAFWQEALQLVERASDSLVEEAIGRVVALKERFCRYDPKSAAPQGPPYPEHQALSQSLAD